MDRSLIQEFCKIAYDQAGIALGDKKEALVAARVSKRLRKLGMNDPRQYLTMIKNKNHADEMVNFLDAISTNFTKFMREPAHFDLLHSEVDRWKKEGRKSVKLWCAASSSGEEPYSIIITILDALDGYEMDFKVLATDISTKVLALAKEGVYPAASLDPLSNEQRRKYFDKTEISRTGEQLYQVKPFVKKHLVFKRLNLTNIPYPMTGPLDMILCRNVMIYFDNIVRQKLANEFARLLANGSLLLTGHSETLGALKHNFKTVKPSVYQQSIGVYN